MFIMKKVYCVGILNQLSNKRAYRKGIGYI